MGILDKLEKEVKDSITKKKPKPSVRYVQAMVPTELYESVSEILIKKGITWQKLFITTIQTVKDEAKKK